MKTFYDWDADWCAAVQRELDPFLEQAKANRKPRTEEEEAEKLRAFLAEPVDPEVEEMVEYLALDMLPEEMARVEERLANDAEYRQRMAPMIWMWEAPISLTPPSERNGPDDTPPDTRGGKVLDFVSTKELRRRTWLMAIFAIALPMAAVWGGMSWLQRTMRQTLGLRAPDPVERAEKRAATDGFANPIRYETGPSAEREVEAAPGIRFRMGPSSRLTVSGGGTAVITAALDGEASVEIDPLRGGAYLVSTPAGMVSVMPGRYAIRAAPGATTALVTIDTGKVVVNETSIRGGWVSISGNRATVSTDGRDFPVYRRPTIPATPAIPAAAVAAPRTKAPAPVAAPPVDSAVTAAAARAEPQAEMLLAGGTVTARLKPNASVKVPEGALGGLQATLVGEATFELRGVAFEVLTAVGRVRLMRSARVAIRCNNPCTEVLVTAGEGLLVLRSAGGSNVALARGMHGRITSTGAEITDGAGYPELPPKVAPAVRDTTHALPARLTAKKR